MQSRKINLLNEELVVTAKYRYLNKISFAALAVYVFVIVGLLSAFFFFSRQRTNLEAVKSNLLRDILALKETEGLLFTLKNRLELSRETFGMAAPAPAEMVEKQIKTLPAGVEVSAVNVAENGTITLALRAEDSSGVAGYIKALKEKAPNSLVLSSLVLSDEGGYTLSVRIK